jgi:excisionase family DNA binding protein
MKKNEATAVPVTSTEPKCLTTDQFAERINVHPQTVRTWVKKGLISPHHKTPSGRSVFTQEQVEEYFGKKQ